MLCEEFFPVVFNRKKKAQIARITVDSLLTDTSYKTDTSRLRSLPLFTPSI